MTLSNIFFGKKVVQQAYLNNALIYQSKGWETLPSTCSEVWTKDYDKALSIFSIAKDDLDNLYIGSINSVYKIDSEGNLKWKYVISNAVKITSIVVFPTYIYCSYEVPSSNPNFYDGYVAKIDVNGNLISTVDVNSLAPNSPADYFNDMQKDRNNIYAITQLYLLKLNQDLKVIDNVDISSATHNYPATRIATNNGPYIFVGTTNNSFRLNKSNLKNNIDLSSTELGETFNISSFKMDNIGNLYMGSFASPYVLKYDVETCKKITTFSAYMPYDICIDSQESVYFAYDSNGSKLKKYSSDGTLIWDNIKIPVLDTSNNNDIRVITDSNNNIYVAYVDNNANLAIKKFINLVKEN